MKTKPMSKQRKHYEREILFEAFRRVFGTDHPSVTMIAFERPSIMRLVNSICDSILREQKETNQ